MGLTGVNGVDPHEFWNSDSRIGKSNKHATILIRFVHTKIENFLGERPSLAFINLIAKLYDKLHNHGPNKTVAWKSSNTQILV